mmetsp:Transcript_3565/g.5001  ORF Transcript_3565/g.5001 Transcript_3565/m.5001 type:complete len:244 (+) Transcript_3565:1-732(+)
MQCAVSVKLIERKLYLYDEDLLYYLVVNVDESHLQQCTIVKLHLQLRRVEAHLRLIVDVHQDVDHQAHALILLPMLELELNVLLQQKIVDRLGALRHVDIRLIVAIRQLEAILLVIVAALWLPTLALIHAIQTHRNVLLSISQQRKKINEHPHQVVITLVLDQNNRHHLHIFVSLLDYIIFLQERRRRRRKLTENHHQVVDLLLVVVDLHLFVTLFKIIMDITNLCAGATIPRKIHYLFQQSQ